MWLFGLSVYDMAVMVVTWALWALWCHIQLKASGKMATGWEDKKEWLLLLKYQCNINHYTNFRWVGIQRKYFCKVPVWPIWPFNSQIGANRQSRRKLIINFLDQFIKYHNQNPDLWLVFPVSNKPKMVTWKVWLFFFFNLKCYDGMTRFFKAALSMHLIHRWSLGLCGYIVLRNPGPLCCCTILSFDIA